MLKTLGRWWKTFKAQLGICGKEFKAQLNKLYEKTEQPLMISRIQVKTDLNALKDVLEWFEQFNALPVTNEIWWQCKTALAEGFTNAVRYANKNLPETTPIDIEVTLLRQWFEVRIWDNGQPFDLQSKLESISQVPWHATSGRGLIFMDQLTDELSYTRTADSRNCLLLRKKLLD